MYLINGYVIAASLFKKESTSQSTGKWLLRKLKRLLPLYWIFTIVFLLLFPQGNEYWLGPLSGVSWFNVLCNLLCVHGLYPYYINSINLNWFVGNLVIWYVLAPLLWRWIKDARKCITFLVIYLPSFMLFSKAIELIQIEEIASQYFTYLFFPAQLPCILFGVLLYLLRDEQSRLDKKGAVAFFLVLVAQFGNLMLPDNLAFMNFHVFNLVITWGVCFALLFYLQLRFRFRIIENRVFAFIGMHSYGIYLVHMIIIMSVAKFFDVFHIAKDIVACNLVLCLIVLALSIGAGTIVEEIYAILSKGRKDKLN